MPSAAVGPRSRWHPCFFTLLKMPSIFSSFSACCAPCGCPAPQGVVPVYMPPGNNFKLMLPCLRQNAAGQFICRSSSCTSSRCRRGRDPPKRTCVLLGTPFHFICAAGVNPALRQGFPAGKNLVRRLRGENAPCPLKPGSTPPPYLPQQFLYFFPLPQGQGSLRPIFWTRRGCFFTVFPPPPPKPSVIPEATRSRLISSWVFSRKE